MYIEEKIESIIRRLDRISQTVLDLDKQVQEIRADMARKPSPEPYTTPYPWNPYSPWTVTNPVETTWTVASTPNTESWTVYGPASLANNTFFNK